MEKEKNSLYALAQALYRKIFFKKILNEQIKNFNGVNSIEEWEKLGRPSPPPAIYKQQIVSKIQKDSHVAVLIETGTFMGDMIYANLQNFKKYILLKFNLPFTMKLSKGLLLKGMSRYC